MSFTSTPWPGPCDKYATDLIRIINIMETVLLLPQSSRECERNIDHEIVRKRDQIVIGFALQNLLGIPIYRVQQRKGHEHDDRASTQPQMETWRRTQRNQRSPHQAPETSLQMRTCRPRPSGRQPKPRSANPIQLLPCSQHALTLYYTRAGEAFRSKL